MASLRLTSQAKFDLGEIMDHDPQQAKDPTAWDRYIAGASNTADAMTRFEAAIATGVDVLALYQLQTQRI